jgi:uncharacterized damage-inducible protein DinB
MEKENTVSKLEPKLSLLWWMLKDVRKVTLKGIEGLSKEQLFQPPVEGEYPIGAYIMHLAEAEVFWLQVLTGKKIDKEIKKRIYYDSWMSPSKSDAEGPKAPMEITEYLDAIKKVRELLNKYMFSLKDSDLAGFVVQRRKDSEHKILRKWIIYHLIEHEAHHRGQMMLLIRKAGFKKS